MAMIMNNTRMLLYYHATIWLYYIYMYCCIPFFAMNIITIAATTATIVTTACLIDTND